jgi:NAD(P)-dependent dehydrogenase (short-subunit alcohol dehydrogenase family)
LPHEPLVFVVTGAAGNLGGACVATFARRGAQVVGVGRGPAPEGFAGALWLGGIDLADPADCDSMIAATLDRFGRVDDLAQTAGGFAAAPGADGDPDLWPAMYRLNVLTTLNAFRAAAAPMRAAGGGALVAVSAAAATRATSGLGAYAATKAGVLRLVEAMAAELKGDGVRVNAVVPAAMDTPENRPAMPKTDPSRWATTSEVAEAIAFLLDPAASGVTGAALAVPGRS